MAATIAYSAAASWVLLRLVALVVPLRLAGRAMPCCVSGAPAGNPKVRTTAQGSTT